MVSLELYSNFFQLESKPLTNSGGWVFHGWIGFSQGFKKEFGIYPPREMLIELARMSKEEREEHTWFGLYLWEKKNKRKARYEY